MRNKVLVFACMIFLLMPAGKTFLQGQDLPAPLILQEMTWTDVREYLKKSDMVIIPMGSTEQHGPHLPLGTDFYEAFEISKRISRETGVVVAPVLLIGYSEIHMGFPGTLSIKPQTMEQVVFEAVEGLIKHGFRKIMFFNYHGGNSIVQKNLIHRINYNTPATAVALGLGSPFRRDAYKEFFDWHAGVGETSLMLFLKPELVRLTRATRPVIQFTKEVQRIKLLAEQNPELYYIWEDLLAVPEKTGKGGSTAELSDNGVLSFSDPKKATREIGRDRVRAMVDSTVRFVKAWQKVPCCK